MGQLSGIDCFNDLEDILQEELLIGLMEKQIVDLRKGLSSSSVSDKVSFLYEVVGYLKGAYNGEGIRSWFQRERTLLGGKSPLNYLGSNWNPADKKAKDILELASSLRH